MFVMVKNQASQSRPRLSADALAAAALTLLDADGLDALSLSAVADQLGVGPSALYSHVDGLDGLRQLVALAATEGLVEQVRDAAIGTAGNDALTGMCAAYRSFALTSPGRFAATMYAAKADDAELIRANEALLTVFATVYRSMGLDPSQSLQTARSTRSAVHGFVALEAARRGPSDESDADAFDHLVETLSLGVASRLGSTQSR